MTYWHVIVCCVFTFYLVDCAVLVNYDDVDEQGLYNKSDHVVILTAKNFQREVYGQKHAQVIQFYNTYCGHCKALAPKYKGLAAEIVPWQPIIKLEVFDCSVEENLEIYRQFDIRTFPSISYIHENYVKGNDNIGDEISILSEADNVAEKLKMHIISKMQAEQLAGRLSFAPPLGIASYDSYSAALSDVPRGTDYVFLVFEYANSTVGPEIALDINDYEHVRVKRVLNNSALVQVAGVSRFPSIIAYTQRTSESAPLTTAGVEKRDFLKAINEFLKSKNYTFPVCVTEEMNKFDHYQISDPKPDTVYYSDLEKTIKMSLHIEVSRYKTLDGEPLQALLNYLKVLITSFPARANLKEYLVELHDTLNANTGWNGNDVYEMVKRLEVTHAPVYTSNLDYIACKGSQQKYRGYTCGLWTLYHTLTVNAATLTALTEGPKVLQAMHGYVKHFFGCTECAQHFQAMAARNRLFDVKDNDKAILWLWISHNEVNLRLVGDVTEDPEYPKIQFPSAVNCPKCRFARGAWNLPAVYQYLQKVYGAANIQGSRKGDSDKSILQPGH